MRVACILTSPGTHDSEKRLVGAALDVMPKTRRPGPHDLRTGQLRSKAERGARILGPSDPDLGSTSTGVTVWPSPELLQTAGLPRRCAMFTLRENAHLSRARHSWRQGFLAALLQALS